MNSERRTVPLSWEMSPPRTRRETVSDVENMSVRELEHHIDELHRSIAALRVSRERMIPQLDLSLTSEDVVEVDHRLPSRLTSTSHRSAAVRDAAIVQPSASI